MNGHKGLTIVVVALLVTICAGYLLNAQQTPTIKTIYEERADLAPVFAMDSSRENIAELYNSKFNVTGWTPNVMVDTQATANEYIMTPQSTETRDYTETLSLTNLGFLTKNYSTTDGQNYVITDNGARWYGNSNTLSNGQPFYGGWWMKAPNREFNWEFKNAGSSGTTTMLELISVYVPINTLWEPPNGSRIEATDFRSDGGTGQQASILYNFSMSSANFVTTVNGVLFGVNYVNNIPYDANEYAIYNAPSHTWNIYNEDGTLKAGNVQLTLNIRQGLTLPTSWTIPYSAPVITSATYANPTQLVNLANSPEGTALTDLPRWSNYEYNNTLINERIGLLVKGAVTIYTPEPIAITVNDSGVYSVNGSTIGVYPDGLYLMIDGKNKAITVNGVSYSNPLAPATDYQLTAYNYVINWPTAPDNFKTLYFESNTNAKARVVDTWIYTDPNNNLWLNPNVKLDNYFSQTLNDGARVIFNGFVSYGSSLTINGRTFDVNDGKITIYIEQGGNNPPEPKSISLNGLAVEYRNNHAVLIATNDGNAREDMGEIVNYTISGVGSWYFDAHIQSIKTASELNWEWFNGWTLSVNQTALLFVGLCVAGFIIGSYFGRGSLDSLDYTIMILAIVAAFAVMVV